MTTNTPTSTAAGSEIMPVKLTKRVLNEFIGWTTSRYNDFLGYGTKKEAVDTAYHSLVNGFKTTVWYRRDKTRIEKRDEQIQIFEIKCASPSGENSNSYWKTTQAGDDYIINCNTMTIEAKYSKRVIKFIKL